MNLKTIAKLAGVSTVTVSNVINGKYHKASKETVERIQKIVEETHYQPSATARSLIMKVERDELVEELLKVYISAKL